MTRHAKQVVGDITRQANNNMTRHSANDLAFKI